MANYTVWECDRCGRQEQGEGMPDTWEHTTLFAPTAMTYCNECIKSINDWFAAGKTPHRKRGPRTKKQEADNDTSNATVAFHQA